MKRKIHEEKPKTRVRGMMTLVPALCGRFDGVIMRDDFESLSIVSCKTCLKILAPQAKEETQS